MNFELAVNGKRVQLDIDPHATLLDVLREKLLLTGTKRGCDEGECGACTVLVEGQAVDSCIVAAMSVNGGAIETVEGLPGLDGGLSPLQRCFLKTGAVQCGFCTPGFLMTATAYLREEPSSEPDRIRSAIAGNICRCTGYTPIVEAVQLAVAEDRQ